MPSTRKLAAPRAAPSAALRLLVATSPPRPLTRFVGRSDQLSELRSLLDDCRLLTLTGPGGSGKTRLAIEVANAIMPAYAGDVAWVDLAVLHDASILPRHVAHALRIGEAQGRSIESALYAALAARTLLLVLDNCEHLASACAGLCAELLSGCPDLRVLATSREPLGVIGEHTYPLPPLTVPGGDSAVDAAAVSAFESAQLFVERATHVTPDFELNDGNAPWIAQICRRLDGLPLAIELAASRTRILTPQQIAERLDDAFGVLGAAGRTAPARHRTLRAAIDWSHDLLSAAERCLFRRLSVFAGGFTIDAAESVCAGGDIAVGDVLDLVAALVDRSLVMPEPGDTERRFRLLETVRQYGRERLEAEEEGDALHRAHAAHFVTLAEQAAPHIFGGASNADWIRRLEAEHANLRAAARWLAEDPAGRDGALRLASALHWFWYAGSHFTEGRAITDAALARADGAAAVLHGRALLAQANLAIWQGDGDAVLEPMQRSVELLRAVGQPEDHAYAHAGLGIARALRGEHEAAALEIDTALRLLRDAPPSVLLCYALYWRSLIAQWFEDIDLARACAEEIVTVARDLDNGPSLGHGLTLLGRIRLGDGDGASALAALREALVVHDRAGDRWGEVTTLEALAYHAAAAKDAARATRLFGAAAAMRRRIGSTLPVYDLDVHSLLVSSLRSALGDAEHAALTAEGAAWTADEIVRFALEDADRHSVAPVAGIAAGGAMPAAALTVHALGVLRVSVNGAPVHDDAWRSARARELLVLLLCHPRGCTREQIGVALWPDASAAQMRNSFHVTLHRLRRALGDAAWILVDGDRYALDHDRGIAFDAAWFEAQMVAELPALRTTSDAAAAERVASALELYRGDLLEGSLAGDWHLEHRERLQRRFVEASLALAAHRVAQRCFAEAADTLHVLLGRDPLCEPAHRMLISCLAESGNRSDAIRAYQRLEALFAGELGVRPSPETSALVAALRQS